VSSTDPETVSDAGDLVLRPAEDRDAPAAAELFTSSRLAAGALFPPAVHSAEEDRIFVAGRIGSSEVWVAERDDGLVGYLDLAGATVHSLYVAPRAQRTGVGTALLELAKARRPDGFDLWVFVTNTPARSLYRAHGLVELETTDGSGNEEGAPDLRMAWLGRDPIAYLRGRIDEVDSELADVVNRRVALTGEIQRHKEVPGHAGRDESREGEIADRLAGRAPVLTPQQWQRLVHEVISVSLDAVQQKR
jgi:ribosomal protein S18 acetylase RimI-like enzyme/chorismate mutase